MKQPYTALIFGALDDVLFFVNADETSPDGPLPIRFSNGIGFPIAIEPADVARHFRCEALVNGDTMPVEPDAVAEFYDVSAAVARESWEAYRTALAQQGITLGEGSILLVRGEVELPVHPQPIPLTPPASISNPAPTPLAWACAICRTVSNQEMAFRCCHPCPTAGCSRKLAHTGDHCMVCGSRIYAKEARDRELASLAEIPLHEGTYTGPVYYPFLPNGRSGQAVGEGYFKDLQDFVDVCVASGYKLPERVWTVELHRPVQWANDVIESALEEHHEDAGSEISAEDVEEFEEFLQQWWGKQKIETWEKGRTAVLVPKPEAAGSDHVVPSSTEGKSDADAAV